MKKFVYLVAILPFFFIESCDREYHNELLESALGLKNIDYKIICSQEEYSTRGEGNYYCVYELNKIQLEKFIKKEKSNYPIKPYYRENWKIVKWKKTPVTNKDLTLFDYSFNKNKSNCLSEVYKAKDIKGNYYCAFYLEDETDPYYVDFFILISSQRRLYYFSKKM
jgi:hypothetical protein